LYAVEGRLNIRALQSRLEAEYGPQWHREISGLLNWPEIDNDVERNNGMAELMEMAGLFAAGSGHVHRLSSCWEVLSFKNFEQLIRDGYRNFKRTIGCNYFNFLVQGGDPQMSYLESQLDAEQRNRCREAAEALPDDPYFEWHDQKSYRYFVLLLWAYARKVDDRGYLDRLEEPQEGNPLVVSCNGQRASQDLANAVLEYYSMAEAVRFEEMRRVLEIGAGYGRTAYVIMALNPHVRYTIVDIPPALWVAQRYLSSVFPGRKVFRVRDFESYDAVRDDMEDASLVCLLPHQLPLLPQGHFDLSLNISSFAEMQKSQVDGYFRELDRLTDGFFYTKQWKTSQNAFDRVTYTEADYPVSPAWTRLYSRTCRVQTAFFEALYRMERMTT
jgi:putative sugar O-methyltransferase